MAASPVEIQQETQDQWLGFDHQLREIGIYGGLPWYFLEHEVETKSEPLRLMLDTCLTIAEGQGAETWRTGKAKNIHEDDADWELVNSWTSSRPLRNNPGQATVWVYKNKKTGKAEVEYSHSLPEIERLQFLFDTHDVRWRSSFMAAELKAREKLNTLLTPTQQLSYTMTDSLLEKGKQSGNLYLIRKNRPTLAFGHGNKNLCALCLHPLAYYKGTWAGVMVPSDEVWVHLNYIRTDELRFWRRANQIPLRLANSGV